MIVMAVITYRFNKIAAAVELTAAVLALLSVFTSDILYRRNVSLAVKSAKRVLTAEERHALDEFALPVAVAAPAGDIVWANEAFSASLCGGGEYLGENILRFLYPKTFRQVMGEKGAAVSYRGREYTVYSARAKAGYIFYFVDDTYFKAIHKEYREKKTVVCVAVFDNQEELIRISSGGDDSRITADVEAVLRRWAVEDMGGFIRRLNNGRYLVVTDDAHVEAAKQRRFRMLDDVREVKSASGMSATVSIGVGRGADTAAESERWARQALDMALGRGGDQVAVKQQGDTYEFFGGLSKGVEKRDKVRTRVIAATLSDHVKGSDHVFLMGHRNSDLDSIGAAVGMWAAIRKGLEKPASIVLNRGQTLAGALVDRVEEAYGQEEALFISPAEAMQSATERSLLIVVDTHSVNFVENSDLLEHIPRIVVIDHHRMMISHIKNALIFYHEPYASSASEMVTELVQYIRGSAIDSIDAEALMAGIALDTKNFVLKTGVRTFEASAFLRRRGADTVTVKKLFSNTLDSYKQKAQLVSGAELYKGCAIATSNWDFEDLRVAAAQAADELLSIQGVRASFVLYRTGTDVNISARSLGDINVQVILEEFGGGGHFTQAGAQIKNISMSDARRALVRTLDVKLQETAAN